MNIIYVLSSGMAGFFVFDAYRVYTASTTDGGFLTFRSWKGLLAHLIVYIAAGLLGLFVNLDVLLVSLPSSATPAGSATPLLAATMLRAFFLGSLGPAGLSKAQTAGDTPKPPSARHATVEDLAVRPAGFRDYFRYLLMR